jgi:hypothetical protein
VAERLLRKAGPLPLPAQVVSEPLVRLHGTRIGRRCGVVSLARQQSPPPPHA